MNDDIDIFDNSHHDSIYDLEWDERMSYKHVLMKLHPELKTRSYMHSAGKCVFSVVKEEVDIENILFDTGALGANYVSREFIEKNKYNNNIVELKPAKVKIQLANKNNIIQVENQVSLTLKFTSDNTNVIF